MGCQRFTNRSARGGVAGHPGPGDTTTSAFCKRIENQKSKRKEETREKQKERHDLPTGIPAAENLSKRFL